MEERQFQHIQNLRVHEVANFPNAKTWKRVQVQEKTGIEPLPKFLPVDVNKKGVLPSGDGK